MPTMEEIKSYVKTPKFTKWAKLAALTAGLIAITWWCVAKFAPKKEQSKEEITKALSEEKIDDTKTTKATKKTDKDKIVNPRTMKVGS